MLMANIDKGVHKMTSLEEKKGTMNSEYFGFMRRNPIKGYICGENIPIY